MCLKTGVCQDWTKSVIRITFTSISLELQKQNKKKHNKQTNIQLAGEIEKKIEKL